MLFFVVFLALFRVCRLFWASSVVHNCHVAVFSWPNTKNLHKLLTITTTTTTTTTTNAIHASCNLQADCKNVLELCIRLWSGLLAAASFSSFSSPPASLSAVQCELPKSIGKFVKISLASLIEITVKTRVKIF